MHLLSVLIRLKQDTVYKAASMVFKVAIPTNVRMLGRRPKPLRSNLSLFLLLAAPPGAPRALGPPSLFWGAGQELIQTEIHQWLGPFTPIADCRSSHSSPFLCDSTVSAPPPPERGLAP